MYAIIYWEDDDTVFALDNDDRTLKLFETVAEADAYANKLEQSEESRVISIEGVKE